MIRRGGRGVKTFMGSGEVVSSSEAGDVGVGILATSGVVSHEGGSGAARRMAVSLFVSSSFGLSSSFCLAVDFFPGNFVLLDFCLGN